jgi:hypothetical protein
MDVIKKPLLSDRLNSDDSGSDNGSGDDALSFHTAASVESYQPPVAAAAAPVVQKQVPPFVDIGARIGMLNEMRPGEMTHSQIIQLLFGAFSRIALALDNKTLTEVEANELYQLISQINIGDASRVNRLTRRQIEIIADIFKESAEGTARDLDLLTTMLKRNGEQVVQQVVYRLDSPNVTLERIFDSEKAVAAMLRLCTTLTSLGGVQPNKCNEFNHRLAAGGLLTTGQPIDMASVTRMSQQEINLNQFIEPDFTFVIDELNKYAKRQEHESNVWKARLRFHKGGRGNMQKQKSQSKKSKPKNTRKSKYKCSKKNKQINK